MNTIQIEAIDTLFFRGGKPFAMGDETAIELNTSPNPTVFWGAIFTALVKQKVLKVDEKEALNIGRVFLHSQRRKATLLPVPNDIYVNKKGKVFTERYFHLDENVCVSSNISSEYLVLPDTQEEAKKATGAFIDIASLTPYKKQFNTEISLFFSEEILTIENKVGIKRENSTRITKDGNLYRIPMLRFKDDWCYLVEYSVANDKVLNPTGILKLGGENKSVSYKTFPAIELEESNTEIVKQGDSFKVYLSSPTLLDPELKQQEFNWTNILKAKTLEFTLFSLTNTEPVAIGGWDLEKREPKPMKKALPAGTVFMLENNGADISMSEIRKRIRSIWDESQTQFGFNQFEILTF